jgi:outer membrane murein-binding lipoprotein Lpp
MSLIDNFSKPRWQHGNPEVRKAAVADLEDPAVLLQLVQTDSDATVRAAALARIEDVALLDDLATSLNGDLQNQARSQLLTQLLPETGQIDRISDDRTLVQIASLTDDPELASRSMAQVKNPDVRMQAAVSHPQARLRLLAARGIDNPDLLQQLMQQSKNRDKAVYRHCKDVLEARQAEKQAEAERQEQIRNLVEKASELPGVRDAVEFRGQYLLIRQSWPRLQAHASADQQECIREALDLGSQRQQEMDEAQAAELAKAAQSESAKEEFSRLLAELENLDHEAPDCTDAEQISRLNATLNEIEERWVAALRHAQAGEDQTARCKSLLNEWRGMLLTEQRLLEKGARLKKNEAEISKADRTDYVSLQRKLRETDKLIATFVWPESHISVMPEPIRQLHEQKEAIAAKLDQLQKDEKQNRERVEAAFEKFREELKTNHFDNADREYRRLRNALRRLSPDHQHRYQHELRPLLARLNEIHDWQGFAIEPKKLDLIERMRALVGTGEDPDLLAGKIKALQKEWKAMGHLAPHRDQELWQEFKAAADEAYEPCKAAFAERATLYQQNVERRLELIAQLVDYEKKMQWPDAAAPDGEQPEPDWKLVQKTLDTARLAFRNIKPVDRKGERKTQKKLKAVCDRIYNHVRQEYERNIGLKEELIERARLLVEMENLEEAISQAKRIQREWKEIGMTPMKVDRKLWKKFRGACDAIFARLDEQRQQAREAVGEQISQAEELINRGRALLGDGEEPHPHVRKELAELKAELREVDLPPRIRQQMIKQFNDLDAEARDRAVALREQKEKMGWQRLTQNIRACALKGLDEKKALEMWQETEELPKGIESQALESFWQNGPGDTETDTLREACIALEVLFEKESPAEDKNARMAYQMRRLVEGMGGQQTLDRDQQLLEHINRFLELRPSKDWAERFCSLVDGVMGTTRP